MALEDRALRERAHLGERDAVVDPQHQRGVVDDVRGDLRAVGAKQVERLRQVVLALRVVGAQSPQHVEQRGAVEDIDAGVDLADLELCGTRVARCLGLHDLRDGALRVTHHAPVAARIREHRRGHRRRRPAGLVRRDQLGDRLGADQRYVAAQYHDGRACVDRLGRGDHRAAGAVGLWLHDQLDTIRQDRGERPRRRIDDHDARRARAQSGAHRPQAHRQPAELVQHLRYLRAHPRPLARSEDHDRRRAHAGPIGAFMAQLYWGRRFEAGQPR